MRLSAVITAFLVAAAACRHAPAPAAAPVPVTDEATRLEGAFATALLQSDSLALDRFLSPDFVFIGRGPRLGVDRRSPPVARGPWLKDVLAEVARLDSVGVSGVKGSWSGDTLTTVLEFCYRGTSGTKIRDPVENKLEHRWLLEGSRWQLLSRRVLADPTACSPRDTTR